MEVVIQVTGDCAGAEQVHRFRGAEVVRSRCRGGAEAVKSRCSYRGCNAGAEEVQSCSGAEEVQKRCRGEKQVCSRGAVVKM